MLMLYKYSDSPASALSSGNPPDRCPNFIAAMVERAVESGVEPPYADSFLCLKGMKAFHHLLSYIILRSRSVCLTLDLIN